MSVYAVSTLDSSTGSNNQAYATPAVLARLFYSYTIIVFVFSLAVMVISRYESSAVMLRL